MLAIFHSAVAQPPPELHSPEAAGAGAGIPPKHTSSSTTRTPPHPKNADEILKDFHASHPGQAFSASFSAASAALAFAGGSSAPARTTIFHHRLFCSLEDVYCMFVGSLENLSSLVKEYGLSGRSANEAMLVIEAYRTLRDRGPYPADQVVKSLAGSFAFVIYDCKNSAVFAALSSDEKIPMYWGIAGDGSLVISDDMDLAKGGCGKSYAPFPIGCMYHSEGGLRSFEHPLHRLKAMPRVDSEGMMCGASFKVDAVAKVSPMPRVGSAANWSSWDP